jgi:transposase
MPAKGFLTSQQLKKLQAALRESETAQLRERILMLLLMNDGKTYREISEFIGCSERTVVYWCVHGDPDNLESLRDGREQGNSRKVTPAYIQLLMETIEKAPDELGYEFGSLDNSSISYVSGGCHRNSVKWRTSQENITEKKVRLPLGKIQSGGQARSRQEGSV